MFFERNTCSLSIASCLFLSFSYVASLHVWRSTSQLARDHPSTIKRRFFSVSCIMLCAPFFSQYFMTQETLSQGNVYEQFGLRCSGLINAFVMPLLLTAILFLGPLTMLFCSGMLKIYAEPMYWIQSWQDLVWVRNHIMAPLSEEWVFRACMMPLLLQCLEPTKAMLIGPLLFGFAHFHHISEQLKSGIELKTALMITTFQFTYTSLFGVYSAYLFLRTGHFVAPLVAHVFCNLMGFPNFMEVSQYPPSQRLLITCNFILGFVLWCCLLSPLTSPNIYDNRLHWQVSNVD